LDLQALALITAPEQLPITRAQAKAHLRVDTTDEDELIDGLIAAATGHVEGRTGYTGRALVPQTWEYYLKAFPADPTKVVPIPLPPLIEVESVKYLDRDGAEQTLATTVYDVNTATAPGSISLKQDQTWPETRTAWNAVRIRFQCGYSAFNESPTDFKGTDIPVFQSAIKLVLADLFANREAQAAGVKYEVNPTVKALLYPLRVNLGL
jgi:uncharacterized phiE125 gp8 family phage protein